MLARFGNWRTLLLLLAVGIVGTTVWYTTYLSKKIGSEERQRVEEWVQASQLLQSTSEPDAISFANTVQVNNEDIPIIATDSAGRIVEYKNLDTAAIASDATYLPTMLRRLQAQREPIRWQISLEPRLEYNVYFGNTKLLNQVRYYPLVQLVVMALFLALITVLITTQNRSTQNLLWAGMAKETAHQMGTPLTSLQGWVEMLKDNPDAREVLPDMEKDVERLKLVSDRFGKIGSQPQLVLANVSSQIAVMADYIRKRASNKVSIVYAPPAQPIEAHLSPTLFDWVLENLLKNALDAIEGSGGITISIEAMAESVVIDITDTGKGIGAANLGRVFKPGFTTKKRGWGLGLSLSKRIVEDYHRGKLFVKQSEPGRGTTFRIELPG
ncbi:MAG: sensor histidine kinase [Bacteroidetes bacterium]|nr:MAG: sensor histidine kinase [Bacteroidota bacterium]